MEASQRNYATLGVGILDYSRLNNLRLKNFSQFDFRIDKKINFKKTALDLYLDVTNWYLAKSPTLPEFTLKRNETNTGFATTDGGVIKQDASNGIPVILTEPSALVTPTIGFIWEF